ncbi:MAG: HIT family protein [Acidimicrobiales bacterium]
MGLERLWAGWRAGYVGTEPGVLGPGQGDDPCVLCRILGSPEPDEATLTVWRGRSCVVVLNVFPYTSGHLMVVPVRHVGDLETLEPGEAAELWGAATAAVVALKATYGPQGINLGANLGRAAGAGVPGHLHLHCLPRWDGDTNFMTAVAEARVVPEALPVTWARLRESWPST